MSSLLPYIEYVVHTEEDRETPSLNNRGKKVKFKL